MVNVQIHGKLGKELGRDWKLHAKTPNEALRAININTDGKLKDRLVNSKSNETIYKFAIDDNVIDSKDKLGLLDGPISQNKILHVWPVVGGSGVDPVSIGIYIAISVVTTAISMILAPSPEIDTGKSSDDVRKDSYLFSGRPTPAKQGMPIPLGYGEMIVYPILVNARYVYDHAKISNPSEDTSGNDREILYKRGTRVIYKD